MMLITILSIILKDKSFHISTDPSVHYLYPEYLLIFFLKPVCGWGNFQIYGAQITGKCICESKNWI